MSCKSPLKGFVIGKKDNGKEDIKITSFKVHHLEKDHQGRYQKIYDDRVSPGCEGAISTYIEIPCGHCIGCRLDYSRSWADRCLLEMKEHGDDNYFITVTYSDSYLPTNVKVDSETGEVQEDDYVYTLRKKDIQNFIKRLRKNTGQKFRYYLCGEYGSESSRPHYHIIAFGLKLDDLKFYTSKQLEDEKVIYYNSETLNKCWLSDSNNGKGTRECKGHIVVAKATWETCAYTARYVMKKLNGELKNFYEENNIQPEFVLMSRKPGIAKKYYEDNKEDIYKYEYINVSTMKGGKKIRPPKYYDKLFDLENPEELRIMKEKRREYAEDTKKIKLSHTTLSYLDMLAVEANNLNNKSKQLLRKEI